jgi:hypothetical protein
MTSSIQGIIIALLIAFLVGILVGYSLVQARARKQAEALKISQRRLEEIEQSHELRLREATEKLRRDYEAELAETIEHYQDQLSQKTVEMEQIYETRFQVLQQGDLSAQPQPLVGATLGARTGEEMPAPNPLPQRGTIEPVEDKPPALSQPELLHLKKQYELRLKEAAQKLQKAYEKQLADHAKKARADLQAEYEKRLAEKLEEYELQFAERQAQLEAEFANRQADLSSAQSAIAGNPEIPTPSEIMGTGDDTTVTLPPPGPLGDNAQRSPAEQYTSAQLEARIQEATEQVREEYEQQLASQLEEQKAEFEQRLQALEADYQQKMEELTASQQTPDSSLDEDLFGDDLFNLDDEMNSLKNKKGDDDDDFGPLDLSDISQLT